MRGFCKNEDFVKILALDLGDVWVGTALSDALGITCKPLKTVKLEDLEDFLGEIFEEEQIKSVVVGLPKTMSTGGISQQTKKTIGFKSDLERFFKQKYPKISWILWDERLSSKRAEFLMKKVDTKEKKLKSHSVAACFILQSYLDKLSF
jgi:putative holliday junction resolvase